MSRLPYFLRELHKNLQRLASFAICISRAPRIRPISMEALGGLYASGMRRHQAAPPGSTDRLLAYIAERSLVRKYSGRGPATLDQVKLRIDRGELFIEAQDWYLSDPALRSTTGAEREQTFARTVAACQELGLLKEKTLTLSSYGDCLLTLGTELGVVPEVEDSGANPFQRKPAYSFAAYFQVLRYDFVFQAELLNSLPEQSFSFPELCATVDDLLLRVLRHVPISSGNREVRDWLANKIKAATKLKARLAKERWKESSGVSIQTLYRPFEDVLYPRLEFLVDVGALSKPQPGRYVYVRDKGFEALRELSAKDLSSVTSGFFKTAARMEGRATRRVEGPEIVTHLRPAFDRLKGITGYAPILEGTVYANLSRWDEDPWPCVEITDAEVALRELAGRDDSAVRLVSDRFRRPQTFRLLS